MKRAYTFAVTLPARITVEAESQDEALDIIGAGSFACVEAGEYPGDGPQVGAPPRSRFHATLDLPDGYAYRLIEIDGASPQGALDL